MVQKNLKLLVITGPTAVGKSDIAIEAAKILDGEIVSADSMQIYRGMDIGTAKIKESEMRGVRHHMIDVVDPRESFNVFEYREAADKCISDIMSRGKVPVICGGTGLYLNVLLYEYHFRKDEIKHEELPPRYRHSLIVLNADRKVLYGRIDKRVNEMMNAGLYREVEGLYNSGLSENSQSMQAIGYKQLVEVIKGEAELSATVDKIKQFSRNYAKRQLTWFRKMKDAFWLNVDNYDRQSIVKKVINVYEND